MSTPFYVLAAAAEPASRLKGFFREGRSSPGWLLTEPIPFRYAGFDVSIGSIAQLSDGDRWEAQRGDRKLIQLYQDGTLIFRVRADQGFLGWGQSVVGFAQQPALNPVAVVEVHASFVHLYARIYSWFVQPPKSVLFTLRFAGAEVEGRRLAMTEYYKHGVAQVFDPELFPIHDTDATAEHTVGANRLIERPNAVTYELLTKFYEMFDASAELIPFVTREGDEPAVDIGALQQLGR